MMPRNTPQNPVYPVDPTTLDVCRPKLVCAECGTVFAIPNPRATNALCPCCGSRQRVTTQPETTANRPHQ